MSDSAEIVLTFSVLTCPADQFMSDSAEILFFTQSNSLQRIVQLSDAFRQVYSAEQGQTFSLGLAHGLIPNSLLRKNHSVVCLLHSSWFL